MSPGDISKSKNAGKQGMKWHKSSEILDQVCWSPYLISSFSTYKCGFYRIFFLRNDRLTELKQSFDHDSIDQMTKIGSALSLFHYELLLSKIYRRDTRTSSS